MLIAYPLVGPNLGRLVELVRKFPGTTFSVAHRRRRTRPGRSPRRWRRPGIKVGVILDLDVGQHRTGIAVGDGALALYELAASLPGLTPDGFQLYDGHNNQPDRADREAAVRAVHPAGAGPAQESRGEGPRPCRGWCCGGTPTLPGVRGHDATCPASSARRARSCCTTPVTARSTPTSPASPRPRCW